MVSVAFAQQHAPVAVGTRSRVTAPSVTATPLVGPLRAMTDQSVSIGYSAATVVVPRSSVTRMESSQGLDRRWVIAGGAVGLAAGIAIAGSMRYDEGFDPLLKPIAWVALPVASGAVGAVVGGGLAPERWRPVHLGAAHGSSAPVAIEFVPGAEARIFTRDRQVTGHVSNLGTDSVQVAGTNLTRLSWADIDSVKVKSGRARSIGMAIGGAIGLGIGVAATASAPSPSAGANVAGTVATTVAGVILGRWLIAPAKWVMLPTRRR